MLVYVLEPLLDLMLKCSLCLIIAFFCFNSESVHRFVDSLTSATEHIAKIATTKLSELKKEGEHVSSRFSPSKDNSLKESERSSEKKVKST